MPNFGFDGDDSEAEPEPIDDEDDADPPEEEETSEESTQEPEEETDGGSEVNSSGTGYQNAPSEMYEDGTEEDAESDAPEPSGGITLDEAREKERRKRVMVWGPPGSGKTHNVYTADPPLAIIDTENKAHDLAKKFEIPPEKVAIWQPNGYEEAETSLHEALDWLQEWLDDHGERGTIVVDSMSMIWEWAKSHYIHEYYIEPDRTGKYESEADVSLKSSLESNDADWPRIKEYHNDSFRQEMVRSPFHFLWTQMATEDFEEKIGKSLDTAPDKPHGEKDNAYKANFILHIRQDEEGVPYGDLEKPGYLQHTFAGLEWPDQEKVFEIVSDIEEAENNGMTVDGSVTDYDVEIIKGKPSRLRGVENAES